jgi:hypothetical protein
MYSATLITDSADLPDTVYAKWGSRVDGTMTKSGMEYVSGTVKIRKNTNGDKWEFFDSSDNATSTIGACLIRGDGGYTPGDDWVEDQFNSAYTLHTIDYDSPGQYLFGGFIGNNQFYYYVPATIVVTRISLCIWEAELTTDAYTVDGFGDPINWFSWTWKASLGYSPFGPAWTFSLPSVPDAYISTKYPSGHPNNGIGSNISTPEGEYQGSAGLLVS